MNKKPNLITAEEKLYFIQSLQTKFHRKGELLLPDDELYPEKFNNTNLNLAAKKILVWLGIKPHNLTFSVNGNSSENRVVLPQQYINNSVLGSGFLAKECVAYLLRKKGTVPDPELIELAIIELGLGLLLINTIGSGASFDEKLKRLLGVRSANSQIISYYPVDEFIQRFQTFIKNNELHPSPIQENTLPWIQKTLNIDSPSSHINEQQFVSNERNMLRESRIKTTGAILCTIMVGVLLSAVYSQRTRTLTPELQKQKESIETLNIAYLKCQESLKIKDSDYNTNDIFMIRQLDAHANRCKSIKNKHDYMVNDYNHTLSQQDYL